MVFRLNRVYFGSIKLLRHFSKQTKDKFVVKGLKEIQPLPKVSLGEYFYNKLINKQNSPALIDPVTNTTITYDELLSKSCHLADILKKRGYGKNIIISILSENCVHYYIPILSAFFISATVAPLNNTYNTNELLHALTISQPKIIFTSLLYVPQFVEIKKDVTFIDRIIILDSNKEVEGAETLTRFLKNSARPDPAKFTPINVPNVEEQVAFISFTAGTSGPPKGVMLTHSNIMTGLMHMSDPRYLPPLEDPSCLGILPFHNIYSLLVNLGALLAGELIIVIKRYDSIILEIIQEANISRLWLDPTIINLLAEEPLEKKYNLSYVKDIICVAGPLLAEQEQVLKKRLKINFIRQIYGLTEATATVLFPLYGDQKHRFSGKVTPYMLCKVKHPKRGFMFRPKSVGELCIKGPAVMKGYYNDEKATEKVLTPDGWLLTGDLAYYDEQQNFYIVDRLDEQITYRGCQVSPRELEVILKKFTKIEDSGVVGLPNPEDGERPLAFIVKKSNVDVSEMEIVKYVDKHITPQKRLTGGVVFVNEIPRNSAGKINRIMLRFLAKKYRMLRS